MPHHPMYAVWVGRIQPFHLGHLTILRRSLSSLDLPHVNGIVCHNDDVLAEPTGKHTLAYNPFTPWERYTMVRTCLTALSLSDRVTTIFVPFLRPDEWSRTKLYLPSKFVMCTTNKDNEDSAKICAWESFGWTSRMIDLSDIKVVSSTQFRQAILAGQDWRHFVHESIHDYFVSIEGPSRLLQSAEVIFGDSG
jgi:nicotinamide-nucleotide adenylyltransferase